MSKVGTPGVSFSCLQAEQEFKCPGISDIFHLQLAGLAQELGETQILPDELQGGAERNLQRVLNGTRGPRGLESKVTSFAGYGPLQARICSKQNVSGTILPRSLEPHWQQRKPSN